MNLTLPTIALGLCLPAALAANPGTRTAPTPGGPAMATDAPAIALVSQGKSAYRIVLPAKPTAAESTAAAEMQRLLREVSGVTLSITGEGGRGPVIAIGATRLATRTLTADRRPSPEDGIAIRTQGKNLILTGGNARGVLYAVYRFAERWLGVRFLARDCTLTPHQPAVRIPAIDLLYAPPFMYREALYFDAKPPTIAATQGYNGPSMECSPAQGGKIEFFPYVHSFCKLVPPEEYFAAHPEYFSLVAGKRTNLTVHGQLCLTNPEVLQIATARVLKWIEDHPAVPIIDVSQNDGEGACECEKCAAVVRDEGSQHGPILRFVNAIADVVRQKHPGKWVETLAYAYSTKPPAITRPRANVIIRLCHAGCYVHGFEKCGLGANLTAYLEGWQKLTRRIFIWHYAANFAHYLAPNPNINGLVRDLRYYAAHGVNGVMVQANYQGPGGELSELRQYLVARLLWDPGLDADALRDEFCRGYYGPSASAVLSYLALLDREAERPDLHEFGAWDPSSSVRPELVAEGLRLLHPAVDAAASDPTLARRVDRMLLPLWYMQLTWPDRYALPADQRAPLLARFRRSVEASAVSYVREDFNTPTMPGWLDEMAKRYPK